MSVNKTIGGLSVLSSANIKGCFSLPVWDSDAQTTKSACITDILSGVPSIFVAGTGANSSIRCGVGNTASECFSSALGGCFNTASGRYSIVGGGVCNIASNGSSFVGSGVCNCATNEYSIVGGGFRNKSTGLYSSILGGIGNCATGARSVVVGGTTNKALGMNSGVLSGATNCAVGDYSVVSGGGSNRSIGQYSSVLGGLQNYSYGEYSSVVSGVGNRSGIINSNATPHTFIIGGECNVSLGGFSGIISGTSNCIIGAEYSTISGGYFNKICINTNSEYGAGRLNYIGVGCCNSICSYDGTLSGYPPRIDSNTISGGYCNVIRAESKYCAFATDNFILGGTNNRILLLDSGSNAYGSTMNSNVILATTGSNLIQNFIGTNANPLMESSVLGNIIVSGGANRITSTFSNYGNISCNLSACNVIVGGSSNRICMTDLLDLPDAICMANNSVVSGITNCIFHTCFAFGCNSSILSGQSNRLCSTTNASILGGCTNTISFSSSNTIVGGTLNSISSVNCSMAFGESNVVAHNYAGAIGCGITSVLDCALHTNRMVVTNMPTSSAGLPSGTLYSDAGTIKIVP